MEEKVRRWNFCNFDPSIIPEELEIIIMIWDVELLKHWLQRRWQVFMLMFVMKLGKEGSCLFGEHWGFSVASFIYTVYSIWSGPNPCGYYFYLVLNENICISIRLCFGGDLVLFLLVSTSNDRSNSIHALYSKSFGWIWRIWSLVKTSQVYFKFWCWLVDILVKGKV